MGAGAATGGAGRGLGRGGGAVWCAVSPEIQRVCSVKTISHPGDDNHDDDDNDAPLRPAS